MLVVDDGCVDVTPERLVQVTDKRLRVLRQGNRGVSLSRNYAIAEARAPWLAFLDDDDFWAPNRLRELLRRTREEDAAWGYGAFLEFGEDGTIGSRHPAPLPADLAHDLYKANVIGTPSTVIARTDLVRRAGCFDPRLSVLADWDLWLRLKDLAPAVAMANPLVAYAQHPENMWLTSSSSIPRELQYMADKHGAGARATGVRFGGEAWDRSDALMHRQAGHRWRASHSMLKVGLRYRSRQDVLRAALMPLGERAMVFASRSRNWHKPRLIEAPPWLLEGLQAQPPLLSPTESSGPWT